MDFRQLSMRAASFLAGIIIETLMAGAGPGSVSAKEGIWSQIQ
jgi:hypothetical protein